MNAKMSLTTTFNKLNKDGDDGVSRELLVAAVRYLAKRAARADYKELLDEQEADDSHDTGQPESEPEP